MVVKECESKRFERDEGNRGGAGRICMQAHSGWEEGIGRSSKSFEAPFVF